MQQPEFATPASKYIGRAAHAGNQCTRSSYHAGVSDTAFQVLTETCCYINLHQLDMVVLGDCS